MDVEVSMSKYLTCNEKETNMRKEKRQLVPPSKRYDIFCTFKQ